MTGQRKIIVTGQSRREFLQAAGVAIPGLTLMGGGTVSELAEARNDVDKAEKKPLREGGDPSYKHLTLDEVARTRHEVHYAEVASAYGGPMSLAPVVSVKAHPEVIWVRPDMGIGMVANPVAFGIGSVPSPIRWRAVERSLQKGYLPIVISKAREGMLMHEQVAYATLLEGEEVKTGHEKQVLMVRMSVVNTDLTKPMQAIWWTYIPWEVATTSGGSASKLFGDYTLFDVVGLLPAVPEETIRGEDDVLRDGPVLLGVHEEGPGVKVTRYEKVMKFEMELLPGQEKWVNLKISSNKKGFTETEIEKVRRLDYVMARDKQEMELEGILRRGMKIQVPEQIVNDIYKAQILYNQTQMVQAADRDYYMPVQAVLGVWPWENMKQLRVLDAYGYHDDVRKSLGYFLKLQGKRPPHANVTSYEGAFPSSGTFEESGWEQDSASTIYGLMAKERAGNERDFPNWTNNTGSCLYAFAEHYFYTLDRDWLESVAPPLIKSCNWIITERRQTMERDAQGQKLVHYGLMPAGQAYDQDDPVPQQHPSRNDDYYVCFTDGYTYQGLRRVADALADVGHPEGPRLQKEAESYREDILEVLRRVRQTDPKLPPYPERLNGPDAWGSFNTGAVSLVDAGLVDPWDPAFADLEKYMKNTFNNNVLGLCGRCHIDDTLVNGSYYMVTTEDVYHYAWIARGELEKALLSFYSALAFGVDKETLGAVERFSIYDSCYAPCFIDSSGGMRICGMIRRTLLFETESELRLLAGTPRRWLEDGKEIAVLDAATYFGNLNLVVKSRANRGNILAELVLRKNRPDRLTRILLRLPHPNMQQMKGVSVNGSVWNNFDGAHEIVELKPPFADRYQILARY